MSGLEDPLEEYSGLSLFSRTLGSLPQPPHPYNTEDPLPLHDFLKSLPVKNPDKLVKEAKNILDKRKSEVSISGKMSSDEMLSHQKEIAIEKVLESPRVRRPGLGRKRARFSLLPNSSQPSLDLDPALDIDKLKDPAEFFKAFERLQNAKKEIEKQTGRVSQEQNEFSTSLAPRPRRPGIPGRSRTVKYQHIYPTMLSQEAILNQGSQQETACGDIASEESEPEHVAPPRGEKSNLELEEAELADPVLKAESRVDKLLDELLAHDHEELDGDGAVNLIQEHLQIKSLDIEKLNLPELSDAQRIDLKASGGIMQNTRRPLSDIHNMFKVTRSKTPLKDKAADNSILNLGSPTPPKNPFASMSLLKKRVLHSIPQSDPFSAVSIDQLPAQIATFSESRSASSNLVNGDKDLSSSSNFKTQLIEEDNDANGNTSFPEIATGSVAHLSDKSVDDNLTALGSHNHDAVGDFSAVLEDNNIDMDNKFLDENINRSDADVDVPTYRPNGVENAVEEEMQQEAVVSVQPNANIVGFSITMSSNIRSQFDQSSAAVIKDHAMDGPSETQDHDSGNCQDDASEQPNEKIKEPSTVSVNKRTKKQLQPRKARKNKAVSRRQSIAGQSSLVVQDRTMDGCYENQVSESGKCHDAASDQPNEKINEPAKSSMNKRIKGQSHQCCQRERRSISRRQSLAASGTSWENGVRRSTRMRSRPLEYWKGERFLYGRIHESLATVIGIKYESPGKAIGKPTLKVKSFVSDEYKDLVELAALH